MITGEFLSGSLYIPIFLRVRLYGRNCKSWRLVDGADCPVRDHRPGHYSRTLLDAATETRPARRSDQQGVELGQEGCAGSTTDSDPAPGVPARANFGGRADQPGPRARGNERQCRGYRPARCTRTGALPGYPRHHRRDFAAPRLAWYGHRHGQGIRGDYDARRRQSNGARRRYRRGTDHDRRRPDRGHSGIDRVSLLPESRRYAGRRYGERGDKLVEALHRRQARGDQEE